MIGRGLLCSLWHRGQMTHTFFAICLLTLTTRALFNYYSLMFSSMSTDTQVPVDAYEEPVGILDAMDSAPNSSSVNAYILSRDIEDDEITSRFVKSMSPASSCGSNSPFGSVFTDDGDDDEIVSRFVPSTSE